MFHFGETAPIHTAIAATPLPEYLARLVSDLLRSRPPQNMSGQQRYFADWIDRVEVLGRAVGIWKKHKLTLTEADRAPIEAALEHAGTAAVWEWYAESLNRAGMLDAAVVAARRGTTVRPDNWLPHARLAELLERRGDLHDALRAVERSLLLTTGDDETALMRDREASLKRRGAV